VRNSYAYTSFLPNLALFSSFPLGNGEETRNYLAFLFGDCWFFRFSSCSGWMGGYMPSLIACEGGSEGGSEYKIGVHWDPFCGALMENCFLGGGGGRSGCVLSGLKL